MEHWEGKHYSFYQNRDCEYFPCHAGADPENFNCLFCYCPLYALGDQCGGAFRYTEKGRKDCTHCLFPHRRENYGKVNERFADIAKLAERKHQPPADATEDGAADGQERMTEKEKSYAELLYQPNDPELAVDRDETIQKLRAYNAMDPLDRDGRRAAIGEILGKTGKNCTVEQPLFCTYGYNTSVGDNFFMNVNGKLMDSGKITIGDNVFIAPNVCIVTEEHAMDVAQRVQGLEYTHPVTIGDNVWICTGAIILPGVTIGSNSVIGAGSVVTKDIPANSLAVGNPCRVIRQLEQQGE